MKRYAKTESVNFCQWTVCHFHMSQFVDYTKTQWSNQCLCNRDSLTNLFFRVTLSSVVFMLIVYLRKYTKTRDLKKWVEIGICLNHCFDSFSQLKEFQGTLIEMFKEVFKSEKNPAWMFCLPLLHLLSGDCTPYEEISEDLSHSDSEPKWWGTCAIKHVVRLFKEKKKKWTM